MRADHIAPRTGSPKSSKAQQHCVEPLLRARAERHGHARQPDDRPFTKSENRGLEFGHGVWDVVIKGL